MATHGLWPEAKRAQSGTSPGSVKRDIGIEEIRNIVFSKVEIPPKNFNDKRKSIEVLDEGLIGIVQNPTLLSETDPIDVLKVFAPGELGH